MLTLHTVPELRAQIGAWRRGGERVALVPTMGNLHRGHLRLVEVARGLAERTVATIFVNPMQFGPGEDYARYPRTLDEDSHRLRSVGLDLLFAPALDEVYPRPLEAMTRVEVCSGVDILCGASRPGHFTGVATVVTKLFNMVQPDVALFGEKDYQQIHVIRRMSEDLNVPVQVVGVPTVREPDGLAMSSRNAYLSARERALAPTLYQVIRRVAERLEAGERDFAALQAEGLEALEASGFRPDYLEVRRAADLAEPGAGDADLIVLAAAWLGRARLIDNCRVGVALR